MTTDDARRDRLARTAARLIAEGRTTDVALALRTARGMIRDPEAPAPSERLVRRHLEGLRLQAEGPAALRAERARILGVAEELLGTLMDLLDDAPVLLAGRAARGRVDAATTLNLRVYHDLPIGRLATALEERGYVEPEVGTMPSRFGRLDVVRLVEEGVPVRIARCAPDLRRHAARSLVRDEPIAIAEVAEVRRLVVEAAEPR